LNPNFIGNRRDEVALWTTCIKIFKSRSIFCWKLLVMLTSPSPKGAQLYTISCKLHH